MAILVSFLGFIQPVRATLLTSQAISDVLGCECFLPDVAGGAHADVDGAAAQEGEQLQDYQPGTEECWAHCAGSHCLAQ